MAGSMTMEWSESPFGHSGIIKAFFYDKLFIPGRPELLGDQTHNTPRLRFYSNTDARVVYNHLREKYPDYSDLYLVVRIMDFSRIEEQREVAARGIKKDIIRHEAGMHPIQELAWLGDAPKVSLLPRSAPLKMHGQGEYKSDKLVEIADIFGGDRLQWN